MLNLYQVVLLGVAGVLMCSSTVHGAGSESKMPLDICAICVGQSTLPSDEQRELLEGYVDQYGVDACYEENKTLAMVVAHVGNWRVLDFLRHKGADLAAIDCHGRSVLWYTHVLEQEDSLAYDSASVLRCNRHKCASIIIAWQTRNMSSITYPVIGNQEI